MRGLFKFAWLPVMALPLVAAPISLSTGTAGWTVTQTSLNTVSDTNGSAQTGFLNGPALGSPIGTGLAVTLTGGLPIPPWASSASMIAAVGAGYGTPVWVGQTETDGNFNAGSGCNSAASTTTCGAAPGQYTYVFTFNSATAGSFRLAFSSDNGVELRVAQGSTTLFSAPAAAQFAITDTGVINYAANTTVVLTATVTNSYSSNQNVRSPSGLIAYGYYDPAAVAGVPEPSTYAMLGLGGVGLLIARMRRRG